MKIHHGKYVRYSATQNQISLPVAFPSSPCRPAHACAPLPAPCHPAGHVAHRQPRHQSAPALPLPSNQHKVNQHNDTFNIDWISLHYSYVTQFDWKLNVDVNC